MDAKSMEPTVAAAKVVEAKRTYLHAQEMADQYVAADDQVRASFAKIYAEEALEKLFGAIDELEGAMARVVRRPLGASEARS